jgi:hypothetical protein
MATVFLSYRHESDDRRTLVRSLAERLEQLGVTVIMDQLAQEREFHGGGPDEGWPRWSKAQARNVNHKILIVASPSWFQCYEGTHAMGLGLGAAAEARVIEQRLYNSAGISPDIRIVAFDKVDAVRMPLDLQGYHCFHDPGDFNDLVQWITGIRHQVTAGTDWPEDPPPLSWVMANQCAVRTASAQLLTRNAPFRYLPIRGSSETGKSQITKQLLGNALRCPGLACGRFDFKGTTDVDAELHRFVQHLGISTPLGAPTLAQRLTQALEALTARCRPALLIFDTFEAAGNAEQWVKDTLLVALIRAKLLRVVITGQHVPERGGAPWDTEACPAIVLSAPIPEDWLEYGQHHKPRITLEFVRQAHEYCAGKPSLLAQLLGPTA